MRVLVCGGRSFSDRNLLGHVLAQLSKTTVIDAIIEGDAPGADRMAGYWARKHRIDNLKFPAEWGKLGKAAGPQRNQRMIDEGMPELVIAFPGGRGTADMIRRALAAGVKVVQIPSPDSVTAS